MISRVLSSKPTPDDKNTDGSPAYNTYEDYIEALTDWKISKTLASLAHVPAVTIKEQAEIQPDDISNLKKRINALESRLSLDEYFLSTKQAKQTEVALDPANLNIYQRLDSDPLQFLVSLKSVTPYLNGYMATINVGNPSTAHFRGLKIKCRWSKPYDWGKYSESSYKAWEAAVHTSEVQVQNDIAPGSWNPIGVILLPATREELGYFQISIESNTVSLSNN
jgi:hypothetical protein